MFFSCEHQEDSITLSTISIFAGNNSESIELKITSTSNWKVLEKCEWCKLSETQGEIEGTIYINIEENYEGEPRSGVITFMCGSATAQLHIYQEQVDMIDAKTTDYYINKTGGTIDLEVQFNADYNISIEKGAEWIQANDSRAWSKDTLTFVVLPNFTFNTREGKIILSTPDKKQSIVITQEGDIPYLKLSTDKMVVSHNGGVVDINVSTNVPYTIQMPNINWITNSVSNIDNTKYSFHVFGNDSLYNRRSYVIFCNEEYGFSDTLKIFQPGIGVVDGYEYIDLGLPSGTLWARYNIGASLPEELGNYFAWGETKPKEQYVFENYKYRGQFNWEYTKYYYDWEERPGYIIYGDNLMTLESSDDAATVNWSDNWRMPTEEELSELYTFFVNKLGSYPFDGEYNGANGVLYMDSLYNDFMFLPAGGNKGYNGLDEKSFCCYWSSSLSPSSFSSHSEYARGLYSGLGVVWHIKKWAGFLVRPVVRDFNK